MRNLLTLMACAMFKMIVFGLLVLSKRIKMVESRRKGSFHGRSWFSSVHARKAPTPLVVFEEDTLDHDQYIKEVLSVALSYGSESLWQLYCTFQQERKRPSIYHVTQKWCRNHFPSFIKKGWCYSNRSDLNPLDYCIWDELAKGMNWAQVLTKQDLIDELHHATKNSSIRSYFRKLQLLDLMFVAKFTEHLDKFKRCHFCTEFNYSSFKIQLDMISFIRDNRKILRRTFILGHPLF